MNRRYHYRNTSSRRVKGGNGSKTLLRFWRESRSTIVIVLSIVAIGYFVTMQPVWVAESQAQTIATQRAAQERAEIATSTLAKIGEIVPWLITLIVVAAVAFAGVKIYEIYSRSRLQWAVTDANGMFPLQRVNAAGSGVGGFIGQLLGHSMEMIVDPNKAISPTISPMQIETQIDGNQQLSFSTTVAKGSVAKTLANKGTRATVVRATMTSMDRHSLPKPAALPALPMFVAPEPTLAPADLIDAKSAFDRSTDTNWIIGQNRETGSLCEINVRELLYWGVLGEKRTGKTSRVGKLLFAYALRFGFKTIVVDGKGGADWEGVCKGRAEFHKLDHTNIGDIIDTLTKERKRRQSVLNQHGVNNIWLLPDSVKPQPVLVIADEFGSVMDSLKATDKQAYDKIDLAFGDFFRLGGSTGLCMTIIDQFPGKWGKATRANLSSNIAFKIGGGLGAAIGEYNLHNLKKDGGFYFEQEMYHGFDTWNHIDQLLPKPTRNIKPMFDFGATGTSDDDDDTGTSTFDARTYAVEAVARIDAKAEAPKMAGKKAKVELPEHPLLTGPVYTRREQIVFQQAMERYGTQNATIKACWGDPVTPKKRKWFAEASAKIEGNN